MWLSAAEALLRLNVKPQTLYANVSRGRIRAKADPADPRRSLYSRDDVDRLSRRTTGRPRSETVAAEAISWGDPVLSSTISTISRGRLWYRGQDAIALAQQATLEEVAELLWGAFPPAESERSDSHRESGMSGALLALARAAGSDPPSLGRSPSLLRTDAATVLATMAAALAGPGTGPIHMRLAHRFGRPAAADDLRCALVLLADHELNVSTFTARVAVSTGAALSAGALAALAALSGPLHGRASLAIAVLVEDTHVADGRISSALRDWLDEGRAVPGFGHRLYPHGDVRAEALLGRLTLPPAYAEFRVAAEDLIGDSPNVDFAMAALAAVHDLPPTAPTEIFALARCVGWLAHMIEQVETGSIIRPRARYTGFKPPVP
jgi:citrate synthase